MTEEGKERERGGRERELDPETETHKQKERVEMTNWEKLVRFP